MEINGKGGKIEINNVKEIIPRYRTNGDFNLVKDVFIQHMSHVDKKAKIVWDEQYNPVIDWLIDNENKGLLLSGECGTGKSTILNAISSYFCHTHRKIIPITPVEVTESLFKCKKQKHIFLDDVGKESLNLKEFGTDKHPIADIIQATEREGKMLLITTNLSSVEMKERYGAHSLDRILGCTKIVKIMGNSHRSTKPK